MKTGIQVGGTSIIMVFVLLCLTVFAVLTLQSAGADARLSEKAAQASSVYYQADAQAETLLADIDLALRACAIQNTEEAAYRAACAAALSQLPVLVEGNALSFSVIMGETHRLDVVLYLPWPVQNGEHYKRVEWTVVPTLIQDEGDQDGMQLFDPGDFSPVMLG